MIQDAGIIEWYNTDTIHENKEIQRILDVDYAHIKFSNDDDIYITGYGLPCVENLMPENFFTDKEWFRQNSIRLNGTSTLYKIQTKTINGSRKNVVLKWNRMGQDIPGAENSEELINAEFNSPFEEFSRVTELIDAVTKSGQNITIQRPLAIYVPSEQKELWQTGRREYIMRGKIKNHTEIELDMHRSYAVIYEWVEGIDAVEACESGLIEENDLAILTLDAEGKISGEGFTVRDNKPSHIIVRPAGENELMLHEDGSILYSLIDFELLELTPERETTVKKIKRLNYLKRQRDRFTDKYANRFHPNLKLMNVLDVDYIYGRVESTKGALWVVGKDPYLFDYFLPERWELTTRKKISVSHEMYYTFSKDNIHLVWKASRVGLIPDKDPFKEEERKMLDHGYNSPFEEISIAMKLSQNGIATIYPRAIYMTGDKTVISDNLFDNSRYESHKDYLTPDGKPILQKDKNYITIWGYWNGPDEMLAARDGDYYRGINLLNAYREGLINREMYFKLMNYTWEKMIRIGIEDLHLTGKHILISLDNAGRIVSEKNGLPELRICNFEFLKMA